MSSYESAISGMPEFKGTPAERALASLLDVVEELCGGVAAGQTPTDDWMDVVRSVFAEHRRELGVTTP